MKSSDGSDITSGLFVASMMCGAGFLVQRRHKRNSEVDVTASGPGMLVAANGDELMDMRPQVEPVSRMQSMALYARSSSAALSRTLSTASSNGAAAFKDKFCKEDASPIKVTEDFEATEDTELSVQEGQLVIGLRKVDSNWWLARCELTHEEGLVPKRVLALESII